METTFDIVDELNAEPSSNETAVVAQPKSELAKPPVTPASGPVGGLSGEFGIEDLRTPYLSLVGKTGKLSEEFQPGSFVYNKEVMLSDGKEPIQPITVLEMHKFWIEDVPYDDDTQAKTWDRLEDAKAEGYSTEYGAEQRVMPSARIIVLIPVPESEGLYSFNHGDKVVHYGRAMWMLQKTAYTSAAKPIITAALSGHLRGGLHLGGWSLTSLKRTSDKNVWYVPVVKKTGMHSPEFRQFLEEEVMTISYGDQA
jgi:hypothetical protein